MKYELTTPRSTPVITVAEAKAHTVIDHDDDDALIAIYIEQATDYCQDYTGQTIGQQGYTVYGNTWCDVSVIPISHVQSIEVKYIDENDTEQTLPADKYTVDLRATPVTIEFVNDGTLPETSGDPNCITVSVVAGVSTLPSQLQAGIYLLTAHLYKEREATGHNSIAEIPFGVRAFLDQVKAY